MLHDRYSRQDMVAVGKFSLNLLGFPTPSNFPQQLYGLLESLVTKVRPHWVYRLKHTIAHHS